MGFLLLPCIQWAPCGWSTLTNQSYERWPSTALYVPTSLDNIWYSEEDIQEAKQISKNLVSHNVRLYFMLWYGSLEIPFVTQAFVLWCRSLRSPFHAYALFCRANIIGSCVTQLKIARIISIVSGVLWWQYATYAFPCIMTKASSGYHLRCTHFVSHMLEGVWLLALHKADWDKVCPGRLRVCSWTVFSFIHLGCCPMLYQWWDEV